MQPFGSAQDQQAFAGVLLGFRVDRATAALPASISAPIFNVVGGRVALLGILGEVTVIIQAQANATKLVGTPTVGTAVDLCATADINALEVGGKLSLAGPLATALQKTLAGANVMPTNGVVLSTGTLNLSCAATNTGSIKWSVWYVPLDDGASITAA
jgi:hypothetical protein